MLRVRTKNNLNFFTGRPLHKLPSKGMHVKPPLLCSSQNIKPAIQKWPPQALQCLFEPAQSPPPAIFKTAANHIAAEAEPHAARASPRRHMRHPTPGRCLGAASQSRLSKQGQTAAAAAFALRFGSFSMGPSVVGPQKTRKLEARRHRATACQTAVLFLSYWAKYS